MIREMARGAFLTGCAASSAALVFAVVHAADRDPWQWPAAMMCTSTWVASSLLVAWYLGCRRGVQAAQEVPGGPSSSRTRQGSRHLMTMGGMIGCILACTLILAIDVPLVLDGHRNAVAVHGVGLLSATHDIILLL